MLVESSDETILWNAKIIDVRKNEGTDKIAKYKVHYNEWSSRFDEWVDPVRVVEPNKNNLLVRVRKLPIYVVLFF